MNVTDAQRCITRSSIVSEWKPTRGRICRPSNIFTIQATANIVGVQTELPVAFELLGVVDGFAKIQDLVSEITKLTKMSLG